MVLTFFWSTLIFLSLTSNMSFMSRISPARVPFSSVRSCSCLVFLLRKLSFSSKRNLKASTYNLKSINELKEEIIQERIDGTQFSNLSNSYLLFIKTYANKVLEFETREEMN